MSVLGSQPDAAQAAAGVVFATSELRPYLTDVLAREQAAWHGMVEELVMGQFPDLAGAVRQDRSTAVAHEQALLAFTGTPALTRTDVAELIRCGARR